MSRIEAESLSLAVKRSIVKGLHHFEDSLLSPPERKRQELPKLTRREFLRLAAGATVVTGGALWFFEWSKRRKEEEEVLKGLPAWQRKPEMLALIKEARKKKITFIRSGETVEHHNFIFVNNTLHMIFELDPEALETFLTKTRLDKIIATGPKVGVVVTEYGSPLQIKPPTNFEVIIILERNPIFEKRKFAYSLLEEGRKERRPLLETWRKAMLGDSLMVSATFASELVILISRGRVSLDKDKYQLRKEFAVKFQEEKVLPLAILAVDEDWVYGDIKRLK